MSTFTKISELAAASALDGTEPLPVVQSSVTVQATGIQVRDYVAASASAQTVIAASSPLTTAFQALSAGIANTVQITGEYMLTEDNELDYSGSFTDGMSAGTVIFSELPADTVAIWVLLELADTDVISKFEWKRSTGGTVTLQERVQFADGGTNSYFTTAWMPTDGNTLRVVSVAAVNTMTFKIIGYKTGA